MPRPAMIRQLASTLRDKRGVATVELALVSTLVVGMMLPLFDIGMGYYVRTQTHTAAEAGAEYAFIHGWSGTNSTVQSNMTAAVTSATNLSVSASPAPSLSCGCVNGTTINAVTMTGSYQEGDCANAFPDSNNPTSHNCPSPNNQVPAGAYVTVNAQASYTPLFHYLGMGSTITFTATSVVRVE